MYKSQDKDDDLQGMSILPTVFILHALTLTLRIQVGGVLAEQLQHPLKRRHLQRGRTVRCTENPLDTRGKYTITSNNMKLVHWPLTGGLLHLVQRGGAWAGCGPAQSPPCCTKCNSPPINGQCTNYCCIMVYCCGVLMNVAIKGLSGQFV